MRISNHFRQYKKSQNIWFRNVNKSTTNQIVYTANPFNSQTTNFAIEDKTSNNIAMFLKGYGQSGGNQGHHQEFIQERIVGRVTGAFCLGRCV